jgi:hypothetical protein
MVTSAPHPGQQDVIDILVADHRQVEELMKRAPTRPHPSAPDHPPFNKLLAPGAGLVDRVRDTLSGRSTRPTDL